MPHWKTLYSYDYLGCHDLPQDAAGKFIDIVVSIDGEITKQDVIGENGRKDSCVVVNLKGAKKPFIINKTNMAALEALFGTDDYTKFPGKKFILGASKVKAKAGGIVNGLRVREKLPTLPELTPQHPQWAGAAKALKEKNTTLEAIKKAYILSLENELLLTK